MNRQPTTKQPTSSRQTLEQTALEDCDAVLICLNTRRFVVVRYAEPKNLWPIDGGWEKLRRLQPGDQVVYKGLIATVLALEVYR